MFEGWLEFLWFIWNVVKYGKLKQQLRPAGWIVSYSNIFLLRVHINSLFQFNCIQKNINIGYNRTNRNLEVPNCYRPTTKNHIIRKWQCSLWPFSKLNFYCFLSLKVYVMQFKMTYVIIVMDTWCLISLFIRLKLNCNTSVFAFIRKYQIHKKTIFLMFFLHFCLFIYFEMHTKTILRFCSCDHSFYLAHLPVKFIQKKVRHF